MIAATEPKSVLGPTTNASLSAPRRAAVRNAAQREARDINRRELMFKALAGLLAGALAWVPLELYFHGLSLTEDADNFFIWAPFKRPIPALVEIGSSALIGAIIATADSRALRLDPRLLTALIRNFLRCAAVLAVLELLRNTIFIVIATSGGWGFHQRGTLLSLFLARVAGWAIGGAGVGAGVGVAARSRRKVATGALGGLIGGLAGGMLFDPLAFFLDDLGLTGGDATGLIVRFVGFCLQGLCLGLGIGVAWEVTKEAWVKIVSGPMAGRQFALDAPITLLGRAEQNAVPLFGDTQVAPQHARIAKEGKQYLLESLVREHDVSVNGRPSENAVLASGDRLQIGEHELVYQTRRGALSASGGEILKLALPAASAIALAVALLGYDLAQPEQGSPQWLRSRADRGDVQAQTNLCALNFDGGSNVASDHAQAVPWCRAAAEAGNPTAQYYLGVLHERGEVSGTQQPDYVQARLWLKRSADQGFSVSALEMGFLSEKGLGDAPDDFAARRWYEQAVDKGVVLAQFYLGGLAATGRGGPKDSALAYRLLLAAAEHDIAGAQWDLSTLYEQGTVPELDPDKACYWQKKAVSIWQTSHGLPADQLERMVEHLNRTCNRS